MNLKTLKAAAQKIGATVEVDYAGCAQVVAPIGKFWFESSGPHLRVDWCNGIGTPDSTLKPSAIADAIDRMKSGYIPEDDQA